MAIKKYTGKKNRYIGQKLVCLGFLMLVVFSLVASYGSANELRIGLIQSDWTVANTPTGLISYYKFDGDARDETGNNHGDIYGADCNNEGKVGKACKFDGVDDYVRVPDSSSLNLADQITLMAWVKYDSFGKGGRAVLGKQGAYGFHTYSNSLVGDVWIGGKRYYVVMSNAKTGVWYHQVLTYDGSSVKLYVNGELKETEQVSGKIDTNNNILNFGDYLVYRENFKGSTDEVKIYNRALSEDEIRRGNENKF